jgi:hypothetical protein
MEGAEISLHSYSYLILNKVTKKICSKKAASLTTGVRNKYPQVED